MTLLAALVLPLACRPLERHVPETARERLQLALATERDGDAAGALAALRALAADRPTFVEAQLELQRLLLALDGADAAAVYAGELEARAADHPPSLAVAYLLQSRQMRETADRRALLRAAVDLRPDLYQAWLDLGVLRREAGELTSARRALDRALALRPDDAQAHIELAYCEVREFAWQSALAHARMALSSEPELRRAKVMLAVDRLIKRDFEGAIEHFRALALQGEPSEGERFVSAMAYRGALRKLRHERAGAGALELAREATQVFPGSPTMQDLLGFFLEQDEREAEALEAYQRACEVDPYNSRAVRDLRRLLFRRGRYAEGYAAWYRIAPQALLRRADNQVGDRYRALARAVHAAPAQGADRAQLVALGAALRGVGWLDEASDVYAAAAEAGAAVASERDELRQLLAFLEALKLRLREHYQARERRQRGLNLDALVSWVNREWPLAANARVDLERDLDSYYGMVREATPFRRLEGSLASALDRYNLAFDLGDNAGYLDMRVARVVFRGRCEQRVGQLVYPYTALVIDETLIDNYLAYLSGRSRISGRAFLSRRGFYVALDTFRPGRRRLRAFLAPPRSDSDADASGAVYYSAGLDARLRGRFLERWRLPYPVAPRDVTPGLEARAFQAYLHGYLSNVWMHELGHVVDFEKYLPFGEKLRANIAVTVGCGFSPSTIVGRFERVAETFSLATTPYPYLCLQDNLDRLELDPGSLYYMVLVAWQKRDPRESPYYLGARQILREMLVEAGEDAGDAEARLRSIAALNASAIRSRARAALRDEGFAFDPED